MHKRTTRESDSTDAVFGVGLTHSSFEAPVGRKEWSEGVRLFRFNIHTTIKSGMIDYHESKSQPVTKEMVWKAYWKVRANQGSAGIDGVSLSEFDKKRSKNLYKIWNRLSSGSYFPPAVKQVSIPKKDGGERKLGIPTVSDRIAQMVVKQHLEPKVDESFH